MSFRMADDVIGIDRWKAGSIKTAASCTKHESSLSQAVVQPVIGDTTEDLPGGRSASAEAVVRVGR